MKVNWTKRGAKILASWLMGYSGGLGVVFPMEAINHWGISLDGLLIYPAISGMIVAIPQFAKVLSEYANS